MKFHTVWNIIHFLYVYESGFSLLVGHSIHFLTQFLGTFANNLFFVQGNREWKIFRMSDSRNFRALVKLNERNLQCLYDQE